MRGLARIPDDGTHARLRCGAEPLRQRDAAAAAGDWKQRIRAVLRANRLPAHFRAAHPDAVLTLHRPGDVDSTERLGRIMRASNATADRVPAVFSGPKGSDPIFRKEQRKITSDPFGQGIVDGAQRGQTRFSAKTAENHVRPLLGSTLLTGAKRANERICTKVKRRDAIPPQAASLPHITPLLWRSVRKVDYNRLTRYDS